MRLFQNIKTFRNWYQHYWDRYGSGPVGKEVTLSLRNGLTIHLRKKTSDFRTARSIFTDKSYLPSPITIPEKGTIIDIGGHIGCFTLFAAHRMKQGKILTFEPEPSNFHLLEKNVRTNRLEQVTLFHRAITSKAEKREMYYPRKKTSTGGNSLFRKGPDSFPVDCTTLPDIFETHGLTRIDLLKLDCEGAEIEILENLPEELLSRIHQIIMEIHLPDQMDPVFDRLERSGFKRGKHPKNNYALFLRS